MRETFDLIEKCGDGSSPSEAHCGGWEGLGKDGGNRRCDRLHLHTYLDYSRVEIAADARHRACSCGRPSQMPCNEADAVRSARPKGKECRHRGKELHGKRVECYA